MNKQFLMEKKRRSTSFKLPRKPVEAVIYKLKACSCYSTGPHQKLKAFIIFVGEFSYKHNVGQYICIIDQGGVKMAGYWPSSLFTFFSDRGKVKLRTRPISSHLDRTSFVSKRFITMAIKRAASSSLLLQAVHDQIWKNFVFSEEMTSKMQRSCRLMHR